uniref:Uncharacterized protein n=1 Tax=mine drainage metagenome TaxID=410659 RepID=E6Q5W0_9ZZZZ
MKSIVRPLAGLAIAVIVVSCGGGGGSSGSSLVPNAQPPGPAPIGSVKLQLNIPPKSAATGRAPAYVSPATQSVSVAIDGGSPTVQNLSPSSPNCSNSGPAYPLLCTVTLSAGAGAHTVTIDTFDQPNAAGHSLSVNSISVTFVAGQSPNVPVVLAGVPASIAVYPAAPANTMSLNPSVGLIFLAAQSTQAPILVEALDADGNPIVGPGSPTLQVSVTGASSGSGIAASAVSGTNPNAFTLSSTSTGSATLAVVATPTAALAGTPVTFHLMLVATVMVSTLAGSVNRGFADGTGAAAAFDHPRGVAYDSANGDLYVIDAGNSSIRQVTPAGVVTTIAGPTPPTRISGFADGAGSTARFSNPSGIVYDPVDGNLYVTDAGNCAIRSVSPTAPYTVTTVAGAAPLRYCGNHNAVGTASKFRAALGITVNPTTGTLYVADTFNNEIRAIAVPGYAVSTIAGSRSPGHSGSTSSSGSSSGSSSSSSSSSSRSRPGGTTYADGSGSVATFHDPIGITFDPTNGDLYLTDSADCAIRQISTASPYTVSTLVGVSPTACGFADGIATTATFNNPRGIAYDPDTGDLYVSDSFNSAIRQVTLSGVVTTVANVASNTRRFGLVDGFGPLAAFNTPTQLVYDPALKSLIVADTYSNAIRQVAL